MQFKKNNVDRMSSYSDHVPLSKFKCESHVIIFWWALFWSCVTHNMPTMQYFQIWDVDHVSSYLCPRSGKQVLVLILILSYSWNVKVLILKAWYKFISLWRCGSLAMGLRNQYLCTNKIEVRKYFLNQRPEKTFFPEKSII